jgi:hypothetical protein
VLDEFSAGAVASEVIEHLERRRSSLCGDPAQTAVEVDRALATVREAYAEAELPPGYFAALSHEIADCVPAQWRRVAEPFTRLEESGFGNWRGGDLKARLTYVLVGLVLGGLMLWAPFIPIWEKWFPFALAGASFFLPDATRMWHRRRYARQLGGIVASLARAQPALDKHMSVTELLEPPKESP